MEDTAAVCIQHFSTALTLLILLQGCRQFLSLLFLFVTAADKLLLKKIKERRPMKKVTWEGTPTHMCFSVCLFSQCWGLIM